MRRIFLSAILLSSLVHADIKATDVKAKYSANAPKIASTSKPKQSIDIGFANTTGNTKTTNVDAKYSFAHQFNNQKYEPFLYRFVASGFLTKDHGTKTAEEYFASLDGEQELMYKWLGFIGTKWLRNNFNNYKNKISIVGGIGRILFEDLKQKLSVKIGPAYNIEQYTNHQPTEKFGSLNEYLEYSNKILPNSTFNLKLGAMENMKDFSNDIEATALFGLDIDMGANLHATIEEELRYDKLPPVGFKTKDTKTIVRLGYKF